MMGRISNITDTVEDLKLAFRVFVIFFFKFIAQQYKYFEN